MKSIDARIQRLEAAAPRPDKIYLTVEEDINHPGTYHQAKPGCFGLLQPDEILRTWTRAELDALPPTYQVVIVSWVKDWKPDGVQ